MTLTFATVFRHSHGAGCALTMFKTQRLQLSQGDAERRMRKLAEEQAALTEEVLETEAARAALRAAADEQALALQVGYSLTQVTHTLTLSACPLPHPTLPPLLNPALLPVLPNLPAPACPRP